MKPPARVRKAPAQVVQTAQRAAAATLRAASSGYKELGAGETPYRADFKRGIEATVDKAGGKPPQRNQAQELVFEDAPTFRPVFEPSQVIRQGAFGGTYWRPIVSGVTGEAIKDAWKEFPDDWFKGVPAKLLTASWPRYDAAVNRCAPLVKLAPGAGPLRRWAAATLAGWQRRRRVVVRLAGVCCALTRLHACAATADAAPTTNAVQVRGQVRRVARHVGIIRLDIQH